MKRVERFFVWLGPTNTYLLGVAAFATVNAAWIVWMMKEGAR